MLSDPPTIIVSPSNVTIVEGQALKLFCNASGHPAPNITWSKIGGGIVGHGDTFTIGSVSRNNEGSYRCLVSNGDECDSDSSRASVTVNCKYVLLASAAIKCWWWIFELESVGIRKSKSRCCTSVTSFSALSLQIS